MATDFQELFYKLSELPTDRDVMVGLEEIIRLADEEKDIGVGYGARMHLTEYANRCGHPEKGIVAFTWCLNQSDQNPEWFDSGELIWKYKVVLEWIPVFASVTRDQIESMQEDFARRLKADGESERTAHYYRAWNRMRMGDYDLALEHQNTYTAMPRSASSDCAACELDRQVELLSRMHHDGQALKHAAPILAGKSGCAEVPEFTNAHLVRSYLRLGQIDEAVDRSKLGYAAVSTTQKYLGTIGDLLIPMIRIRDFDTAVPWFERTVAWTAESHADELKMRFFSGAGLLLTALHQDGRQRLKVRLPVEIECGQQDDYSTSELGELLLQKAEQIAQAFNDRNGNQACSEYLNDSRMLCNL